MFQRAHSLLSRSPSRSGVLGAETVRMTSQRQKRRVGSGGRAREKDRESGLVETPANIRVPYLLLAIFSKIIPKMPNMTYICPFLFVILDINKKKRVMSKSFYQQYF